MPFFSVRSTRRSNYHRDSSEISQDSGRPDVRAPLLTEWPLPEPRGWTKHVNAPQTEAELAAIRRCVQRGCPFGSDTWTTRTARSLGLTSTLQPRGRPKTKQKISGGGQTKSQPYFANSLAVQMQENYGQVRAVTANPGKPLANVYVKVYARMKDGSVRFYKDGYTDVRGRFEYASLNTNDLEYVDRFAMLILSDEHGAVVREAAPPQQ